MGKIVLCLPLVPVRGMVVLPEMVTNFNVTRKRSIKAIEQAMTEEQQIFLITQKDVETEEPEKDDLYPVGCVATIRQVIKLPHKVNRVLVAGVKRAQLEKINKEEDYDWAEVTEIPDINTLDEEIGAGENPVNLEAMVRGLKETFEVYLSTDQNLQKEVGNRLDHVKDLTSLVNQIGSYMPMEVEEAQAFLMEPSLMRRYEILTDRIVREIQIQQVKEELQARVKERVDENQREYILREELQEIREELGDENTLSDAEEFEQQTEALTASDEVKDKIRKEIRRFENSIGNAAENGVSRTYIETMLEMPWDKTCGENQDLDYAKKVLEEDHYGLEDVKERILEYLSVRILTHKGDSPILCLVGPPGTGKSSIARSLARALGRPFERISLGGVRDEAEIRGHRKTYVGAMPGRIATALRSAGVKNPVLLLDEIDKVSGDYRGDTASALLEVLDSEQNYKFRDHYLEVPMDLSKVLFITTANDMQNIPRPLLDRMEVIEVNSYTENEKMHIAKEHLIPRQMEHYGLKRSQLSFSDKAIWKMAVNYTREAGVRQLEREIGEICRKAAKEILETGKKRVSVTGRNLSDYLGRERYTYQKKNTTDEVGIVRGLAWTSVGGDTLEIEVNVMPGQGEVQLTGQLGDVMKESAWAGITYIRSVGEKYGIPEDFFKTHDLHVHIPEGAVPKDGPSAGITMATAMLSAVTGRKVRADVAMTGEITLRGRVLPIGGLKEKLLAAKNAGIRMVLVPKENKADVDELSGEITGGMEIRLVSNMEEVLKAALIEP